MTRLELDELREEARLKYDHPTKPTPMLLNPRGVLALIARGDRLEAAGLLMERLLKRASEALYCGVRGVPLGRNAWELSGEIDFYLAAREEDRRSAAPPVRFPEEQLSKEGSAVAPVPGDAEPTAAEALDMLSDLLAAVDLTDGTGLHLNEEELAPARALVARRARASDATP